MSITVGYRVGDHGWATVEFACGDRRLHLEVSYITDALGDLVRAAGAIAGGAEFVRITFAHEPAWTRLRLDRHGDVVELTAWRYVSEPDPLGDQDGLELFRAEVPAVELCAEVSAAAHRVLDHFGVEGYLAAWTEAPFPVEDLAALDAALSSHH